VCTVRGYRDGVAIGNEFRSRRSVRGRRNTERNSTRTYRRLSVTNTRRGTRRAVVVAPVTTNQTGVVERTPSGRVKRRAKCTVTVPKWRFDRRRIVPNRTYYGHGARLAKRYTRRVQKIWRIFKFRRLLTFDFQIILYLCRYTRLEYMFTVLAI